MIISTILKRKKGYTTLARDQQRWEGVSHDLNVSRINKMLRSCLQESFKRVLIILH